MPRFALVDPFDDNALGKIDVPFPFWLKPVKAHSSLLGYRVCNARDFIRDVQFIRAGIARFAEPLDVIMSYADLPAHIAHVHGGYCIAEQMVSSGRQCTLEGYVFDGEVEIYGIVDSIRGRNRPSFERYEYPSRLPVAVKDQMKEIAYKVLTSIGFDNSLFNMEFFYDQSRDHIWLLEINARISKSHSPLFEKVDGVPHKEVMIDVALGRRPDFPAGGGRFRHAAKFMIRAYGMSQDMTIIDAADNTEVRDIEKRFPGAEIQMHVGKGMRLCHSHRCNTASAPLPRTTLRRWGSRQRHDRAFTSVMVRVH